VAAAEASRAAGNPRNEPAKTALTKAAGGTAGVGASANLDRGAPNDAGSSAVAMASAARDRATQKTAEGPSLSPTETAQVSRSRTDAPQPTSTLAKSEIDVPTAAAADQVAAVNASSSASVQKASSNAESAEVNASKGSVEVDTGPTRIVAAEAAGRSGGGGQPELNYDTQARNVSRTETGGAPDLSVKVPDVDTIAAAPSGTSGGEPQNPDPAIDATAIARNEAGSTAELSGGPSTAIDRGPTSEPTRTEQVASLEIRRAELADAAPGDAAAGGGDPDEDEDEEEKRKRLQRERASAAPTLALGGPAVGPPASPTSTPAGGAPAATAPAASTSIASSMPKQSSGAAAPAAGGPSAAAPAGEPAAATAGPAATAIARTPSASGGQPGASNNADTPQAVARSNSRGAPALAMGGPTIGKTPAPTAIAAGGQPDTGAAAPSGLSGSPEKISVAAAPPASGQPAGASQAGPPTDAAGGALAATTRADRAEGGGAPAAGSTGDTAPQLTRSGGAPPTLAMGGPVAPAAAAPATTLAGGPGAPAAALAGPAETAAGRATTISSAPATGGPSATAKAGPPEDAGGGQLVAAATPGRAEAAGASAGQPAPGGGSGAPTRTASGPKFVMDTKADVVAMAGSPSSTGTPAGAPAMSQGAEVTRLAGGAVGPPAAVPTGMTPGAATMDVPAGDTPGSRPGLRRASSGAGDTGPLVAQAGEAATAGRSMRSAPLPGAELAVASIPSPVPGPATDAYTGAAGAPDADESMMDSLADAASSDMSRQHEATGGGANVQIEAAEGEGGLGATSAPSAGSNTRRASKTSPIVAIDPTARFPERSSGGKLNYDPSAVVSADAFRRPKSPNAGMSTGGKPGAPTPQTEEAVELGLLFLARHQEADGSWSFQNFGAGRPGYEKETAALESDTAATGMSLLAFQGAGYNHREHKHRDSVKRAIDWLLKQQKDNGDLFVLSDKESNRSVWLYSHAIATLALCEAYGMTQDPALREPAQKAVDFIVAAQHPDRGGWRYSPRYGSDTSVTGWMMMALKSGELANLTVPEKTYEGVQKWLNNAMSPNEGEKHLYRYNPVAPDTPTQVHGRTPGKTMTSVGLLMRLYSGWKRDNPAMLAGARYLEDRLPTHGTRRDPQRDTYYWYYATQVMFHMGGEHWKKWNDALHPLLVDHQVKRGPMAGSWNPRAPVEDRWAPHAGRLYVTTLNLLSLEVFYRHLPLYESTAK